ncbi:MAG: immunoglobulin-like domain-containing protein [Lachnospiraceae bacterium]
MSKTSNRKKQCFLFALILCICVTALCPQKVEAAGSYYAQVNKGTNVVTIFNSSGQPVKAFTCSAGNATPIGTFYTSNKYVWHVLDGNVYGQYCTRITGGVLFHSVWYYAQNKATQSYAQYNKLGTLASHGCVRLTVAASKWIYDNCPSGMRVTIINGTSANDPLGKPATIHVNASQKMGWDPTDPDPANPYRNSFPTIDVSGVPRTIECGSGFYAPNGMKAKDSLGNDITSSVVCTGNVNAKKIGTYTVKYSVTDGMGRTATATVTVKVVDTKPATITGVSKKTSVREYRSYVNMRKGVKAKNASGTNLTSKIKLKVIRPGEKKEHSVPKGNYQLKKVGTYKFIYYVKNPNNKKTTKVVAKVKVQDTKPPVLSGVKAEKKVEYKGKLNLRSGVKAKLVSGKSLTKNIKISVRKPGEKTYKAISEKSSKSYAFTKMGTYKVQYCSTNPTGKKTTKKYMTVKVQDTKAPKLTGISKEITVECSSTQNLLKGVKAKLVSGKDLTSKVTVEVKAPDETEFAKISQKAAQKYTFTKVGDYTIVYSVKNPTSGVETKVQCIIHVNAVQTPDQTGDQTAGQM